MERINESFMEGIKESTEIKMGVAHVACNGVCVCVCVYETLRRRRRRRINRDFVQGSPSRKDENLIFKI